jgi:hypothetical protein
MGTRLTTAPAAPGRLRPRRQAGQADGGGKGDHVAGPQGPGLLPHRRPCRRSSRPRSPFVQGPPRGCADDPVGTARDRDGRGTGNDGPGEFAGQHLLNSFRRCLDLRVAADAGIAMSATRNVGAGSAWLTRPPSLPQEMRSYGCFKRGVALRVSGLGTTCALRGYVWVGVARASAGAWVAAQLARNRRASSAGEPASALKATRARPGSAGSSITS